MFKKVGITTALTAALIFGGAFSSNAEASSNQDQAVNASYKIYYSVNGQSGTLSQDDIKNIVNKVQHFDWKSLKASDKEQGNAQENVKQPEKQEAPAKQESAKEQPTKEEPAKEAPAEQAEAPAQQTNQQPAKQEEQTNQNQEAGQLSQFEQEVVELTNQERAKQGLAPLEIDTELSKVARAKSNDMATNNYFDHNSPTYGSPFDMMKSFGIDYKTAGENIAKGQQTPEEVVNAWMNSEGHRANILNADYTHIGVGYVENGNHWTQQFIGK